MYIYYILYIVIEYAGMLYIGCLISKMAKDNKIKAAAEKAEKSKDKK